MTLALRAALLVTAASLASAATTSISSSSSGSSIDGINTRSGFPSSSGGSAHTSSTSINGRPVTFNSDTSGTGQNRFSSFNSLGTRGGFQTPRLRPFQFRVPQTQFPQYYGQNSYYGGVPASRFGSGQQSNFLTSRFGTNRYRGGGALGVNVDDYFNRLANNINQAFAAGLGR